MFPSLILSPDIQFSNELFKSKQLSIIKDKNLASGYIFVAKAAILTTLNSLKHNSTDTDRKYNQRYAK